MSSAAKTKEKKRIREAASKGQQGSCKEVQEHTQGNQQGNKTGRKVTDKNGQ